MSKNIIGSIRLAEMINNFWENRAKKKLANALETIERALENEKYFGYLARTDKIGYLRALSKAKETFRGLNKEDLSDGMVNSNGINPLFIEMVEDFYYSEIRKDADINQLKLARYNALRDELIVDFEKNGEEFLDEYANDELKISREEMFEKIRKNELVFAFCPDSEEGSWVIADKRDYKDWVLDEKIAVEDYPLALIKD